VLYAREPDLLLNPASNVKLFTAATALARLGPEYRFDTEVWTDAAPSAGAVRNLYVRGKGDPTFVTERMWALAGDIAHRGVRTVKGDLVIDDSFFDGQRQGPGFDQEEGDRSYLAPAGAVSLNFNTIAIHVSPGARPGEKGRVEVEPASDYLEIENRTRTVKGGARRRVQPSSVLVNGRQRIRVEGRLPVGSRDQVFYRRIDDPPAYFGATLKRFLELRGLKVSGKVRVGAVAPAARLLVISQSEALGEVVRKLDKSSNNFMAEQLLKTLGAEKRGAPGTWAKGVAAVEDFLAEIGIARGSYVMTNGSGLNDANRFTSRQVVTLLVEMWKRFPVMADFLASLPVAGKDGTTRWRMEATEGRLRAKTGTLERVTALSGYVETSARERLAFAILVNDAPARRHLTVRGVDAVATALAVSGGTPGSLGAAVASVSPPPPGTPQVSPDVKAHVATYYQLARAADARNVAFLRTSLQSESDPVLRMAAAEAVYLSDPDSGSARRVFLDAVASEGTQLPRLRAVGTEELPAPVVGSLADLAAQGDDEAMQRLVEISPVAMSDPSFVDPFSELWEDVTRNAPEELLPALAAAPAPAVEATLAAVARGIVRASEPDHPLRATLRDEESRGDTQHAAFARSIGQRLDEDMAATRTLLESPPPKIGPR
jgi:D-alanyl-D-alanine carboxypeptidase/D-alanyl-D-alanine-endopeptidase (penicillin-binding protein 4)